MQSGDDGPTGWRNWRFGVSPIRGSAPIRARWKPGTFTRYLSPMPGCIPLAAIRRHTAQLDVECLQCPRRGRISVDRLIAQYGPDAGLPTADLIGDCPMRDATLYRRCRLRFSQLVGWF